MGKCDFIQGKQGICCLILNYLCCEIASILWARQMFTDDYFTYECFEGSSEAPLLGHSRCKFSEVDSTSPSPHLFPLSPWSLSFFQEMPLDRTSSSSSESSLCSVDTPCLPGALTPHLTHSRRECTCFPASSLCSFSHRVAHNLVSPAIRSSVAIRPQFWVSQNAGDRFQALGVVLLKPPLSRLKIKVEN